MKKAMLVLVLAFLPALCVAEEPTDKYLVQAQKVLHSYMQNELGMIDAFNKLYDIELAMKKDKTLNDEQKRYIESVLKTNKEIIRTLKYGTKAVSTPAQPSKVAQADDREEDNSNGSDVKEEEPKEKKVNLYRIKVVSTKPLRDNPGTPKSGGFVKKGFLYGVEYTVMNKNNYSVYGVRVQIVVHLSTGMKEEFNCYIGGSDRKNSHTLIGSGMTKTQQFTWAHNNARSYTVKVVEAKIDE